MLGLFFNRASSDYDKATGTNKLNIVRVRKIIAIHIQEFCILLFVIHSENRQYLTISMFIS